MLVRLVRSASTGSRRAVLLLLPVAAAFVPTALRPRQLLPVTARGAFLGAAAASVPMAAGQRAKTCDVRRFLSDLHAQAGGRISVEDVLKNPKFPAEWPYSDADFKRMDENDDEVFYEQPRLVTHIDDKAIAALTEYYAKEISPGSDILDICSSWISHFPADFTSTMGKRVGLGMNEMELKENKQLTEYVVSNLNKTPKLPFDDNSFDVITCVVSVDYLNKPLEIFREAARVLRPGGKFILSQSNRMFPTKAIQIWLNTNDLEHVFIIGSYFHYSGAFQPATAVDISPRSSAFSLMQSDPMFIIQAEKK